MDLEHLAAWAERLQAIIVGVPAVLAILAHLWHNVRTWAQELEVAREDGFAAAAEYLWKRGQAIKADLRNAEKSNADLLPRLRELAPDVLVKFGLASGASRTDVEKLLELARLVHKARKGEAGAAGELVALPPPVAPSAPSTAPGASSPGFELPAPPEAGE